MITTAIERVYNDTASVLGMLVGSGTMAILLHTNVMHILQTLFLSMLCAIVFECFKMKMKNKK